MTQTKLYSTIKGQEPEFAEKTTLYDGNGNSQQYPTPVAREIIACAAKATTPDGVYDLDRNRAIERAAQLVEPEEAEEVAEEATEPSTEKPKTRPKRRVATKTEAKAATKPVSEK